MRLPKAHVSHLSARRLRIRIPSEKGNAAYFDTLQKSLSVHAKAQSTSVNELTGSLLLVGDAIDLESLAAVAEEQGLFTIREDPNDPSGNRRHLPGRAVRPLQGVQRAMDRMTGGNLDLTGLIFFVLVGTGAYQILRGNFGAPPWYTAFWYAFGVFTKQLADKTHQANSVQ